MPTLEQEAEMREARAKAGADRFFSRPLYGSASFLLLSGSGLVVVVLAIRLAVMSFSNPHVVITGGTLTIVALWSAIAWLRVAENLEALRAFYLNETSDAAKDTDPLAIALMNSVNTMLNGLFFTYVVAFMLLCVIYRAFRAALG